jgi:dTDP-4-dehydrorhamnose reductase
LYCRQIYGLYHLTNAGQCNWYEFAAAIFEFAGLSPDLTPVPSEAFPTRARRPSYSVLDNLRLRSNGFAELLGWRDALRRYVAGRGAAGRVSARFRDGIEANYSTADRIH